MHNYQSLKVQHMLKYIPGAGPNDITSPHECQQ